MPRLGKTAGSRARAAARERASVRLVENLFQPALANGHAGEKRRGAGAGLAEGEKPSRPSLVATWRWPENVRPELAAAGVERLVQTMYGGRRERIVLPPGVAAVAFGG